MDGPPSEGGIKPRRLRSGQTSMIMVAATDGTAPIEVNSSNELLIEAPNWTQDGRWLILNADGRLWRVPADGGPLEQITLYNVPDLNNDHVLAPDGLHIYVSANDWHIYEASLSGGNARRVTRADAERMHFLHGISPDGRTLAYVGIEPEGDNWWARANLFLVPAAGGPSRQLTFGASLHDGCEFSPDGSWIYFNTERFSDVEGHAQIARIRPDGSELQQLTFDERVNWFPHLSPDGTQIVYLSYPPGTKGHPADLPVEIRLVRDHDWTEIETVVTTRGGQGTINVNSWAPDSRRFAFVSYPLE